MGWTPPGPYPTHALIWAIYGPYMIWELTQSLRDSHPIRNGGSAHDFDASRMLSAYPLPSYRPPQPPNTGHMRRSSSKNMKILIYSAAGPNPYMQLTKLRAAATSDPKNSHQITRSVRNVHTNGRNKLPPSCLGTKP